MDRFEQLLHDLGLVLGLPLYVDKHGVCELNFNHTLRIQLDNQRELDSLLVATFIAEIPAGAFRKEVLKETLKANFDPAKIATFGYCAKNNQLALFRNWPYANLNAALLADFLGAFFELAKAWKISISEGRVKP